MLGTMLSWISNLFAKFSDIVKSTFNIVFDAINKVLKKIEDAINTCIDFVNGVIDKMNKVLSKFGKSIDHIGKVTMQIDASLDTDEGGAPGDPPPPPKGGDQTYDKIGVGSPTGDITNNDYSTTNKTQNITIVIENYAAEVDVDDLVNQLNRKLAEAM